MCKLAPSICRLKAFLSWTNHTLLWQVKHGARLVSWAFFKFLKSESHSEKLSWSQITFRQFSNWKSVTINEAKLCYISSQVLMNWNIIWGEIVQVFGSAGVIGNPMGFARSLGLGIKDFLSLPVWNVFQVYHDRLITISLNRIVKRNCKITILMTFASPEPCWTFYWYGPRYK